MSNLSLKAYIVTLIMLLLNFITCAMLSQLLGHELSPASGLASFCLFQFIRQDLERDAEKKVAG